MSKSNYTIRRLLINDASLLKRSYLIDGSITSIEDKIRTLLISNDKFAYVVSYNTDIVCLAIFQSVNVTSSNYFLHLSFIRDYEYVVNEVVEILDLLIHKALFDKQFHKLSLVIKLRDKEIEQASTILGMVQEAVLHDEIQDLDGNYEDAGLFYIMLPQYRRYNVGFLPFQRGVLAVFGNDEYVDKISTYHYGDKIEEYIPLSVAKYYGLVDCDNRLLPRNSEEYNISSDSLPKEVSRAITQLKEYFLKQREEFDIKLHYSFGTSFQHCVWNAISGVKYGSTVSYIDIASSLSSSKDEARKLTRAVGAACSDNPIPIIIPSHRVIGKDGKLVGYSEGIDIKDFLLQHESIFLTIL